MQDHSPEGSSASNSFLDALRENSSQLERETAEWQSKTYEQSLLLLMRRSGDNVELINSMRDFVAALANRAMFGDSDEPLRSGQQADLVDFFTDASNRLDGRDAQGQHTGWSILLPPQPEN